MAAIDIVRALPIWASPVEPHPLGGGMSNANFLVEDHGEHFFVRVGADMPVHGIMRAHEAEASRAAAACGLSPALLHVIRGDPGALVFRYVAARTLTAEHVRARPMLEGVLRLLRTCHRVMPEHLRGAAPMFWVFHVVRSYARTLAEGGSRHASDMPALMDAAATLAQAVGPFDPVFCHNDLLAANLMDDGQRLWLVDWEYGGFNSPLFDLANLASNNELAEADERWLLEAYFERPLSLDLWRRYRAMKCASLLREAMWSMAQEIHATLDFDYARYTDDYRARFTTAYRAFQEE
jgi:thiamine kinase-like enzyme